MPLVLRPDIVDDAIAALTGEAWSIVEAPAHVPARPGLYAIYGDDEAWRDLGLEPRGEQPLYVGKAESSLAARELNEHFAASPTREPSTGRSTVRRSFAALLRDALGLRAVPRNLARPGRFSNYALAEGGDARLTGWMHERLSIAVWAAPTERAWSLSDVETAVIARFTPPINIAKNPGKIARLGDARASMAAEASQWRAESAR